MQTAIWNGNRAIIASFGALLPLTLVAFFNINALGITPEHFDTVLRDPLALATAPLAVIIFLLIIAFLSNSRVPGTELKASAMETNLDAGTDNSSEATGTGPVSIDTMLPLERAIANLLMEGYAKGEIARKLHLSATEVNESVRVIRRRLAQTQEALPEERFERIAETYGLTKREMQVLRCVVEGKSNGEIAAELFIVEETVKFHMKNLTRKLPVNGRRHMRDWLMSK
jgi:DNA-binding CsgD family transcriptional regulator